MSERNENQAAISSEEGKGNPDQLPKITADLVKMKVDSENVAFNLIIAFIGVAQRRGVFNLEEAAKIFECIKLFKRSESAN